MGGEAGVSRRMLLVGLLLAPPLLAACEPGTPKEAAAPDPLIALADAARADVALVAAVEAANPALAARLGPLRDARTRHAAALDAAVTALDPSRADPTPTAAPTGVDAAPAGGNATAGLPALRSALSTSGDAAAAAALTLPMGRAGLLASVAACCTTYAEVLA